MDIKTLSKDEKKELATQLAKYLRSDVEIRESLIHELQTIDSDSADSDIKAWADKTTPSK